MKFKVGDLVRRTGVGGPLMRLGSVWEVVGVEICDNGNHRIKVPRLGWYAAEGFALDKAAPDPVVLLKATPHKWAKEIKAWADGAEIEIRSLTPHGWTPWQVLDSTPGWYTISTYEYRIKPEKKPDVVLTRHISKRHIVDIVSNTTDAPNVQYTFDGETGKLKAVQLLSN